MNAIPLRSLKLDKKTAEEFWGKDARWQLFIDGKPVPSGTPWRAESPFGSVKDVVVLGPDGKPVFDRPVYEEAPNVNCISYGIDKDGVPMFAIIRQPRPHADEPGKPGVDGHPPVLFAQIPMGFLNKLTGIAKFELPEEGAVREVCEETGATAVISIERPKCPWHNPNPTFVRSWSDLFFVKVDLKKVEALKKDRNEPIYTAEYVTWAELCRRTAEGKDETGAYYRMCTANSLWFIFYCTHPELCR